MAAILRVKRSYYDEPLNALVISCKRQKIVEDEDTEDVLSDSITTLAKFAGTVKEQDENVEHLIQGYGKDELRANFKQHPIDTKQILSKIREATKLASAENRYKVVNYFRSLDNSSGENSEKRVPTVVIDVEDSKSIARRDSIGKDDNYVYDLYYVQSENDMFLDDEVSVHAFEQELVHDSYRDYGYPESECDSEDSNSESNWRNDYPDSSYSEGSIDEDDIREAVMNIRIEEGSDLSEEDDFVYAIDETIVENFGYKYARYKARMLKELEEGNTDDDDDTDDDHDDFSICVSEDSDEHNNNEVDSE
ncbi:probable RNA polymerase II nuclear localization protein SLC7A6OS [Bombus vosnesenskii]|uniref:Probable RNA polymerase II nuclear localization protein SLC7A6OS n=1 Tax=Bombus vosnesenskii TaxID=207650 RepID=A0A6J3K6S5_9HYME|nr:probable RNA polymerase II nuclear localization protein SLC7A6OS [Bombus vosnesenskii]